MLSDSTDLLGKVAAIVEANLSNEKFNIGQLIKELNYSYIHIYRKIQEATGLSPSIYIRHKRLDKACQFLEDTDLTINQIAFQVGFKTQSYFSAKFSEYKGCSPTRYRQQHSE